MEERVQYFVKSKSARVFFWMVVLLLEFFFIRWIRKTIVFSDTLVFSIILVGFVLTGFCILYWFREKRSTEGLIYFFLLLNSTILRLETKEAFERIIRIQYRYLKWIIFGYVIFRLFFPFRKCCDFFLVFFRSWQEIRYERAKERESKSNALKEEREKQLENIKERNKINRKARQDKWKHIGSLLFSWGDDAKNSIADIIIGLRQSDKSENVNKNEEGELKRIYFLEKQRKRTFLVIIVVTVLLMIVTYITMKYPESSFAKLFGKENGSAVTMDQIIERLIHIVLNITVLIITIIITITVISNIVSQLKMVMLKIWEDIIKERGNRSITSSVIFALTVGIIIWWIASKKKITREDISNMLSSGEIVLYPLAFVLSIIIISFFTQTITESQVEEYLKRENVVKIISDIFDLAIGSVRAVVTYLKLVTSDYLSSLLDLTLEEDVFDDLDDSI